jgi:hypothetical protein
LSSGSPSTSTHVADPNPSDGAANAAPLGASASSSIDVGTSSMMSTTRIGRTRARASHYDMWQDMEEVNKVVAGKEVRCGAICNYCKTRLSTPSTVGTDHLHCHIRSCKRKSIAATSSSQSHLHFDSDGNVQCFQYNRNVARSELAHLIDILDLPLNIGEQPAWEDCIRIAHNPNYKYVSRQTTTRDLDALFYLKQVDVKQLLEQTSYVYLIFDIWSGLAKEDYLSVVFHFVTNDYELATYLDSDPVSQFDDSFIFFPSGMITKEHIMFYLF